MKRLRKLKVSTWWKSASKNHLEKSASPLVILIGIFVTCAILIRLVRYNFDNRYSHDREMQVLLEPVLQDGLTDKDISIISKLITDTTKIQVAGELEGIKLNHVFGKMGKEQHLPRYPGDRLNLNTWFLREGMAPSVGAFGYFVNKQSELTNEIIKMEKYYIAVQTLYLPNWNAEWSELKPWFAFRKMLVVNPSNGKMVVSVIADAGPAKWTGKQFGGSPEVFHELNLSDRQNEVIVLFIKEEPGMPIQLGPVNY